MSDSFSTGLDKQATKFSDDLARFADVLRQLPPLSVPRILDLGCGNAWCALAIRQRWPEARIYGVDRCEGALQGAAEAQKHAPGLLPVQADVRALPLSRHAGQFGLIVARHPDVDRSSEIWRAALLAVPRLLCVDGLLLVTCYTRAELDRVRSWLQSLGAVVRSPKLLTLPDPVGHDRYVAACRMSYRVR